MNTITQITDAFLRQTHGSESLNDCRNLADCIWMLNHGGVTFGADMIWDELVHEFERLNLILNASTHAVLSRELVYSVNGLLMHCLKQVTSDTCDSEIQSSLLQLAWRIGVAWDAVLAGDIEAIGQHVEMEELARGDDNDLL